MYRTLSELRDIINSIIDKQGEDAPCAAFVFTQDVLADVGGSDYIYEQVGEMIDDAIRYRKKLPLYAN